MEPVVKGQGLRPYSHFSHMLKNWQQKTENESELFRNLVLDQRPPDDGILPEDSNNGIVKFIVDADGCL